MAEKEKRIFNLLKPVAPPTTAWDQIYDWLLGKAKIVVLITELIIAATFILKVIEDTAAKNKDKQIETLSGELALYSENLEPKFRMIQSKSADYMVLWQNSSGFSPIIDEVFSYIENPSSEVSVVVGKTNVTVFGFDDLGLLKNLEASMKDSPTFTNVGIRDLTVDGDEIAANKGRYSLEATIIKTKREPLGAQEEVQQ